MKTKEIMEMKTTQQGITLIALVVTIVVLLILSGVTINSVLGDQGIFKTAKEAATRFNEAQQKEEQELANLMNALNDSLNDSGMIEEPWEGPSTIQEAIQQNVFFEETKEVKDDYGNSLTIPKGCKVTSDATKVPEGIVIEDEEQNQFVWIPVGIVKEDSTGSITSNIQLGRYIFDTSTGQASSIQYAYTQENPNNYLNTDGTVGLIENHFTELSINRQITAAIGKIANQNRNHNIISRATGWEDGNQGGGSEDGNYQVIGDDNTTAKNLPAFIESVKKYGGYYIGRYEVVGTESKIYSKAGAPMVNVSQLKAADLARNMYQNNGTVGLESDLVSSYAWDTATVFIQEMGNPNYANQVSINSTKTNTGGTGDKRCNIYDMASNVSEWTTEYSDAKIKAVYQDETVLQKTPCTYRGGSYEKDSNTVATRNHGDFANNSYDYIGFRIVAYIK